MISLSVVLLPLSVLLRYFQPPTIPAINSTTAHQYFIRKLLASTRNCVIHGRSEPKSEYISDIDGTRTKSIIRITATIITRTMAG